MKSFISCSEMLHAISVQRSRCICSIWPEYLSANLWNVWCRINIKSRFGIHGWANEIWSSLFSLPISKSMNVLMPDDLGYEDRLGSFYSKEKEISIKWKNKGNDVLLAWMLNGVGLGAVTADAIIAAVIDDLCVSGLMLLLPLLSWVVWKYCLGGLSWALI